MPKHEPWDCTCGAGDNTSRLCRVCGDPKPDRSEVWRERGEAGAIVTANDPGAPAKPLHPLEQLNRDFFVTELGGKHFVACERWDPVRKRHAIKRYSFDEFKKRFPGETISIGEGENAKHVSLPKAWLNWCGRKQYLGGISFDPTGSSPPNVFNLWRGWPFEPKKGDWSVIRDHIRYVICGGERELERYLIGWMVQLVQYPDRPGGVVPVLRGKEGAGKTVLGTAISRMFPRHSLSVSSPRAVTGQFNAHLHDLVLLIANEAVFAGDRANFSTLKALITDETLFIEQKGIDAIEVPNFLHIIMTTNADWAVPVTLTDRRFAVFDVADTRIGDRHYFDRLFAAVRDDRVIAAMLWDLLNVKLNGFDIKNIPDTAARQDQQAHSLHGADAWLLHVLTVGSFGTPSADGWLAWASTKTLIESHELWAVKGRHREAAHASALGKYLHRFFKRTKPRVDNPGRLPGYQIGDLENARDKFCAVLHLPTSIFDDYSE